jgi:hypothetical protein
MADVVVAVAVTCDSLARLRLLPINVEKRPQPALSGRSSPSMVTSPLLICLFFSGMVVRKRNLKRHMDTACRPRLGCMA